MQTLYLDAEAEDGYHRDGCVFADEIDIFDTELALRKQQANQNNDPVNMRDPLSDRRHVVQHRGPNMAGQAFLSDVVRELAFRCATL
jgi:hypothetical protein